MKLVIKGNNTGIHEPCRLCGQMADEAPIPFAIFEEGDYQTVCENCIKENDPGLGKMLSDYYQYTPREEQEKIFGIELTPLERLQSEIMEEAGAYEYAIKHYEQPLTKSREKRAQKILALYKTKMALIDELIKTDKEMTKAGRRESRQQPADGLPF